MPDVAMESYPPGPRAILTSAPRRRRRDEGETAGAQAEKTQQGFVALGKRKQSRGSAGVQP